MLYEGFKLPLYFATVAKSLQSCLTLCNPTDSSPPGTPSLGFSRQEHWSGLPFPSPMHESEKWMWSHSVDSWQPHGPQPTRFLHPWDFPGKSAGVGCHCLTSLRDYPKDPLVKTLSSYCRGHRSIPGQGLRSCKPWVSAPPPKKVFFFQMSNWENEIL